MYAFSQCTRRSTSTTKVGRRTVRVCAQHQTAAARGTLVLTKPKAATKAGA
jgi:hypothetical protein